MVALNSDFAASKPDTDTKNRVGRFFSLAAKNVREDRRSSRNSTGEKQEYRYDTTSVDTAFEYGPFGELIRATGEKKNDFNFRFSTKYEDTETGLLYYGYRYYNAETGRWLSRDPTGELGGINLHAMVRNSPVNRIDYLGLNEVPVWDEDRGVSDRYCDAARKYPKNKWLACACRVSRQIDGAMAGFMMSALLTDSDSPEFQGVMDRAKWFRCTRSCMVKKWQTALKKWEGHELNDKEEAELTPAWDEFCKDCKGKKISEKECCKKQVEAEQDGLQRCMESCGKWKWGTSFPVGQTPGWDPDWDFNDLEKRIQYGLSLCCEEKEGE